MNIKTALYLRVEHSIVLSTSFMRLFALLCGNRSLTIFRMLFSTHIIRMRHGLQKSAIWISKLNAAAIFCSLRMLLLYKTLI